tara:strand:+ start:5946 stop:6758 length:813 start_codon:yes stop_codon:yes gene_type:complete
MPIVWVNIKIVWYFGYKGEEMSLVTLENVCLDYIVKTGSDSVKKTFTHLLTKSLKLSSAPSQSMHNSTFRALNNINLSLKKGDRVGILGRNGAGKSTLLRVLAKVYKPNHGKINIHGTISSLFDVNLGMNIEATGLENIVNLAVMRGIAKKKALEMLEDVATFTQLGDFLHQPVRTYSTGMQMKLAFAVATGSAADIMLIDEIIGAGDSHFMERATKRLERRIELSSILVLTSHSNETIKRFCNKALVLHQGEVQFFGDVQEGIHFYEQQ